MQHAARRVRKPHLRAPGALLLQIPPDARERPARPSARDERVDRALRLRPDLRARRAVVRLGVRGVVELVRPDCPGRRARIVPRLVVVVARVVVGHRGHGAHLGAQHPQQIYLLLALRVRHVDDAPVAPGAADVREADPRVPRGPFDDRAARLESTSRVVRRKNGTIFLFFPVEQVV